MGGGLSPLVESSFEHRHVELGMDETSGCAGHSPEDDKNANHASRWEEKSWHEGRYDMCGPGWLRATLAQRNNIVADPNRVRTRARSHSLAHHGKVLQNRANSVHVGVGQKLPDAQREHVLLFRSARL